MTRWPIRACLFDLDGTLLDTAPDLCRALNRALADARLPGISLSELRPWVSRGDRAMIQRAIGAEQWSDTWAPLHQGLLDHYRAGIAAETRLFPGMAELIADLEARGLPWGVVTNKPAHLTEPLLEALALRQRCACVVSGDTVARPKPAPDPLWHACEALGIDPAQCLYVGDAERDIASGLAAGTHTLIAGYGYLHPEDTPDTWGAQGCIDQPSEVLDYLG